MEGSPACNAGIRAGQRHPGGPPHTISRRGITFAAIVFSARRTPGATRCSGPHLVTPDRVPDPFPAPAPVGRRLPSRTRLQQVGLAGSGEKPKRRYSRCSERCSRSAGGCFSMRAVPITKMPRTSSPQQVALDHDGFDSSPGCIVHHDAEVPNGLVLGGPVPARVRDHLSVVKAVEIDAASLDLSRKPLRRRRSDRRCRQYRWPRLPPPSTSITSPDSRCGCRCCRPRGRGWHVLPEWRRARSG